MVYLGFESQKTNFESDLFFFRMQCVHTFYVWRLNALRFSSSTITNEQLKKRNVGQCLFRLEHLLLYSNSLVKLNEGRNHGAQICPARLVLIVLGNLAARLGLRVHDGRGPRDDCEGGKVLETSAMVPKGIQQVCLVSTRAMGHVISRTFLSSSAMPSWSKSSISVASTTRAHVDRTDEQRHLRRNNEATDPCERPRSQHPLEVCSCEQQHTTWSELLAKLLWWWVRFDKRIPRVWYLLLVELQTRPSSPAMRSIRLSATTLVDQLLHK